MLLVFPVTFEIETSLTPKRVARKLDGDLIEFRPTMNVLATGKFMKKHKDKTLFYGRRTSQTNFQLFHHTARKRDGSATGFYGIIQEVNGGSRITGKFRKPLHTYIFGAVWTLIILFFTLIMIAIKENTGAIAMSVLWLVGFALLFWDNKKQYLRNYLESFPPINVSDNDK